MPSGVASPACSAIVQQFLRGRSASSPSTNPLARRRGSSRPNPPPPPPSDSLRPPAPPPRPPPAEPPRPPAKQLLQPRLPAGGINPYAVARGHRLIVGCSHNA